MTVLDGTLGAYYGTRVSRSQAVSVGTIVYGVDPAPGSHQPVMIVGDAPRFSDRRTEGVRRRAIAEAVEVVRAGLAHLVPRDRNREALDDLLRPSVPR